MLDAMEERELSGLQAAAGAASVGLSSRRIDGRSSRPPADASRVCASSVTARLPIPAVFITGDQVQRGKPDPQGYLWAAASLRVEPADAVVLEDAPAGIAAARAGGMRVVGLATTHAPAAIAAADLIVPDLRALRVAATADGWIRDRSDTMSLRAFVCATVVLAGTGRTPILAQGTAIDRVAWLQGCWITTSPRRTVEENWMPPRAHTMIGVGRTTRGDSLIEYEIVVLRERSRQRVYEAHPAGQPTAEFVADTVGGARRRVRECGARLSAARRLPEGRRRFAGGVGGGLDGQPAPPHRVPLSPDRVRRVTHGAGTRCKWSSSRMSSSTLSTTITRGCVSPKSPNVNRVDAVPTNPESVA